MFAYYAEDLEEDEINYEYEIRGLVPATGTSLAIKRADLEELLKEDRINPTSYHPQLTIEEEQDKLDLKLAEIESGLQGQISRKNCSRLLSLRNRIFRAPYQNRVTRQYYVDKVNHLVNMYFGPTVQMNPNEQQNPINQINPPDQQNLNQNNHSNVQQSAVSQLNPNAPQFAPSIVQTTPIQNMTTPNNSFLNPNSASSPRVPGVFPPINNIPNISMHNQSVHGNVGSQPPAYLENSNYPQCDVQSINYQPNQVQPTTEAQTLSEELKDFIKETIRGAFSNYVDELAQFTTPNVSAQTRHQPETCNVGINTSAINNRVRNFPLNSSNASGTNNVTRGDLGGPGPSVPNRHIGYLPPEPIQNPFESIQVDNNPVPLISQFFENYSGPSNNIPQTTNNSTNINQFRQNSNNTPQPNNFAPIPNYSGQNNSQFNNQPLPQPNQQQTNRPQEYQHPSYYHHLRTKIEKWQIIFSGETGSKSLSVAEFIRQVSILANANRVSNEELLQQAYLFFTGEARKWYFTYWEKFATWDHLVYYLTMNFENPNKDSAIEDEMRERKHKSNERFSSYLADMERLSQSLSQPMDPRSKLKLIFDNTKISYRRRLALVPIQSINDLARYCYQFDSFEPNLYANTNVRSQHQGIHQLDLENFEKLSLNDDEEDEHEINAVQTSKSYYRNNRNKNNNKSKEQNNSNAKQFPRSQNQGPPNEDTDNRLILCWNCKGEGHFAKDCPEPKSAYCYACGEPNVSKRNCPNQHICDSQSKNED